MCLKRDISQDDVVSDYCISRNLHRVVPGIPNDIAFDNVGRSVAHCALQQNRGILGIVHDVISHDIAVATLLDLNTVALVNAEAICVMHVVVFDNTVGDSAPVIITPKIHALAGPVCVMYVVSPYDQALVSSA